MVLIVKCCFPVQKPSDDGWQLDLTRRVVTQGRPRALKIFFRLRLQNMFQHSRTSLICERLMACCCVVLCMSKGGGHGFNCVVHV